MKSMLLSFIFITSTFLAACGGGDAGITPMQTTQTRATLSFSAKAVGAPPTAPLQVVRITVKLPLGASIKDVTTAVTGKAGQLDAGTLLYSTLDNTVSFSIMGVEIKLGDVFAEVKCDLASGSSLDANSFKAVNSPLYPFLEMSGFDLVSGSTVNFVNEINIDMAVSLQ
ncbi:MAG: hypothetical protein PHN84_11525 [Desulfuromonadaceae bacterium]|nr:hypothetical protein [Desulfuromonadaceae bacterium]MDD2854702.1 hypothetical protein [Desulfuromonadaceae bacterium]